jgi:hypothetical protein
LLQPQVGRDEEVRGHGRRLSLETEDGKWRARDRERQKDRDRGCKESWENQDQPGRNIV